MNASSTYFSIISRDNNLTSDRPPPAESDAMAIRTTAAATLPALQHSLKSLHRRISQYVAAPHPIWSDSADSAAFLDCIDDLHATIRRWNSMAGDKSVNACLDRAEDLLQQAMFRLEDEFKTLMQHGADSYSHSHPSLETRMEHKNKSTNTSASNDDPEDDDGSGSGSGSGGFDGDTEIPIANPVASSESDYYGIVIDGLPSTTVADLNEIARRMVAAGFGKECAHAYSLCRLDFLEESLSRLGLPEKLSAHQVQSLPWSHLEEEIDRWSKAAFVVLRILFPSERRLCDRVFFPSSSASHLSFMEVCRASAVHLLNFADAVALGSRSPERLFKILDLFETLRDLIPDFQALFSADPYCVFLRTQAVAVWKRLGDAIRATFMELEHLISRDPAKSPVPAARLHPITRYVINYLRAASRSRQTLHQIFDDTYYALKTPADRPPPPPPTPSGPPPSSSSFSVQIAWIMELLQSNLEAKSNVYTDPALSSIFLLNNQRYIVQKVQDSHELESLLGDDWVRKHSAKARLYAANYQRNSWSKALSVLKLDPNAASASNSNSMSMSMSMRERLNSFNACLEANCKVQSAWVIPDEQVREDLRKTIAGTLVPPYRNFMANFQGGGPESGKPAERSGRCYSAEEVEAKIGELFRGSAGSSNGGARK